jgi:hypothetical protein
MLAFVLTQATAHALLRALPFSVDPGLTASELRSLGISFNPDHRVLLTCGVPVGAGWPDWRSPSVLSSLSAPVDGILFDVTENAFWLPSWGIRPSTPSRALSLARSHLAAAPVLVPVYKHRYAPALPASGLPVFSVVQTDVVVYGVDLADYLHAEFGVGSPSSRTPARVPFWSSLL